MCYKAVDNYPHAFKFVPDSYITQKICDKAVNIYHSTIQLVPDCYKTQEMCDKAVNRCFLAFFYISNQNRTQEMCDSVISEDPFQQVYCPDRYKTEKICDEAINDCLAALKFILHWFVTSKVIKKLFTALYADNNILSFNEYSGDVIISYNEMGILGLLTLMILIMMKITLELLFMSDFWLGIANLNNGT